MVDILRDFVKKGDLVLLGLCVTASFFGLGLVYTATQWLDNPRFVIVQFAAIFIGVLVYIALSVVDFQMLTEKCWKYILGFNIGFNLLVLTPLGEDHDSGNLNWLSIPGFPFDIQPNEVTKMSYMLIVAFIISKIQEQERDISSLTSLSLLGGNALIMIGLIAGVSGDMGMCVIYICITLVMAWSGGVKVRWFVGGFSVVLLGVLILWFAYLPYTDGWDYHYQIMRFRVLFDHDLDPQGFGWQQTRSILALGSGQIFGQGYLQGLQTQSSSPGSLPARHTDFIFSVCGEELGILGCLFLLMLLGLIILRCIWVANSIGSYFAAYYAMGVAGMLLAQVLFNVGMCLFIMPVMGLTLPFISYGGSSMITLYAAMGIVSGLRARALPSWIRDRSQMGR